MKTRVLTRLSLYALLTSAIGPEPGYFPGSRHLVEPDRFQLQTGCQTGSSFRFLSLVEQYRLPSASRYKFLSCQLSSIVHLQRCAAIEPVVRVQRSLGREAVHRHGPSPSSW